MKIVFGLVGLAAALFLIGGVGTIASFVTHADGPRLVFMWIFLAGIVPTMAMLAFSLGIAVYHMYLTRIAGREPAGWFESTRKGEDGDE